ncbi:hypothetical protein L1049_012927 [Liquidambar formosana]|uniref:BSD2 cysteine rich domain-containing protein n=1 Tax=Liquidambar formosana TaxID=63359 RepID=A0AAP0WTM2_LIQFO
MNTHTPTLSLTLSLSLSPTHPLMAKAVCFAHVNPFKDTQTGTHIGNSINQKVHRIDDVFRNSPTVKFNTLKAKAAKSNQSKKPNSVICADCDGNGAVLCSQCKGSGVNSIDYFNGQFKVGESCWLCGGKKDMLCGNCNGAGFVGGFMSTFDE